MTMTRTSQAIDISDWDLAKVEGYLEAIRGDSPSVEVSLIVRTDGHQQLTMALTDDPASGYIAHQCQVCQSITASKILPIPRHPGLKPPRTLDPGDEDDEPDRRHHDPRNGTDTTDSTDATRAAKKGKGRVENCEPPRPRPRCASPWRTVKLGLELQRGPRWDRRWSN
jgi:hypothetical protein